MIQLAVFVVFSEFFDSDVESVWNFENSVEQYQAKGGTSKSSVLAQIEHVRNAVIAAKNSSW